MSALAPPPSHFLSPPLSTASVSSISSSSTLADLSPLPSPSLASPPLRPKTSSFFASPWSQPASPPPLAQHRGPTPVASPRRAATADLSPGPARGHDGLPETRSQSLNASFFAPRTLPTPSPDGAGADASGTPTPGLSPLARLFPLHGAAGAAHARFLDLDATPRPPDAPPARFVDGLPRDAPGGVPLLLIPPLSRARRVVSSPVRASPQQDDDAAHALPTPAPSALASAHASAHIVREAHAAPPFAAGPPPQPGAALRAPPSYLASESGGGGGSGRRPVYRLRHAIGAGAFSAVWLAEEERASGDDIDDDDGAGQELAAPLAVPGRVPVGTAPIAGTQLPLAASPAPPGAPTEADARGARLVAVKMTDRRLCEANDRTRVSFVREAEVLRHVSHRNIVALRAAFSTPAHHVLVLEHIPGGELLELVNGDAAHAALAEPLLRRVFGELAKALGWMHEVGLVHRDVKLENVLLTRPALELATSPLPPPHAPVLKLSDFGLARFVDPSAPALHTRCGSDAYAAPELVSAAPVGGDAGYDGRATDAWALGVVLYALAARAMPFAPPPDAPPGPSARRRLLMKIAAGTYRWPDAAPGAPAASAWDGEEDGACSVRRGAALAGSPGVRAVVARLLVREPARRARVAELWEHAWMWDAGAPLAPASVSRTGSLRRKVSRHLSRSASGARRKPRARAESAGGMPAGPPGALSASPDALPPAPLPSVSDAPDADSMDTYAAAAFLAALHPRLAALAHDPAALLDPARELDALGLDGLRALADCSAAADGAEDEDEEVGVEEHGELIDEVGIDAVARMEVR